MVPFDFTFWEYSVHHGQTFGVRAKSGHKLFNKKMKIINDNAPFVVISHLLDKTEYESAQEAMNAAKMHHAQYLVQIEKETRDKWIPPMLYSEGVADEIVSGLAVPYYDGVIVTLNRGIFRRTDGAAVTVSSEIIRCHGGCDYCRFDNTLGVLYVTNSPHKTVQEILEFGTERERKRIKYNVLDYINMKTIRDRRNNVPHDGGKVIFPMNTVFHTQKEFQKMIAKYKGTHYSGIAVFKPNRRYEPGYKGYISDAVQTIRL